MTTETTTTFPSTFPTKPEEKFTSLQRKARIATTLASDYAMGLRVKYGSGYYRGFIGRGEETKLATMQARADKAQDALFAYLDTIGGRTFRSGFPCHWIVEHLTYADAVTRGQMSVVAPPAYGLSQGDMVRNCGPVQQEAA